MLFNNVIGSCCLLATFTSDGIIVLEKNLLHSGIGWKNYYPLMVFIHRCFWAQIQPWKLLLFCFFVVVVEWYPITTKIRVTHKRGIVVIFVIIQSLSFNFNWWNVEQYSICKNWFTQTNPGTSEVVSHRVLGTDRSWLPCPHERSLNWAFPESSWEISEMAAVGQRRSLVHRLT